MRPTNPSNRVLMFLHQLITSYNDYRIRAGLSALSIGLKSDVSVLLSDSNIVVQILLSNIESLEHSMLQALERHTFVINVFSAVNDDNAEANLQLNDVIYDLRKAITQLRYRDFNLGFEIANFEHPSVEFDLNATENASFNLLSAQLRFSIDIAFAYSIKALDGTAGDGFDWQIILGGEKIE